MKTKTQIVIELPDHVADAVVELSKTIDIGTLLRDALGGFGEDKTKEGIMALMALAYSAGRASVIAEVEGITITDVCKDGY